MNTNALKEKFRAALKARGLGTLPLLSIFKEFDTDQSGELTWEKFNSAFRTSGLAAAAQEIRALFLELDKDGNGTISFNEFVKGIRGPMSARRKQFLSNVFRAIDRYLCLFFFFFPLFRSFCFHYFLSQCISLLYFLFPLYI